MSDKPRFPRADALAVVRELLPCLQPLAERLVVAGSLRRRKPEVGDVEILFIPKIQPAVDPDSLFGELKPSNVFDRMLDVLVGNGVIVKRESKTGSTSWGALNKYARHVASGIPVDFFTATDANWFNYLVCRTGGQESNTAIAAAAIARGWKWNPYGSGFERRRVFGNVLGEHVVRSEQEVFNFVGMDYLEPWERR